MLSVSLDDTVASTKLPYTTTEGIWKKAGVLVTEVHSVVPAPGFRLQDKMVKTKSGSTPHLVTVSMSKRVCITDVMTSAPNTSLRTSVRTLLPWQKSMETWPTFFSTSTATVECTCQIWRQWQVVECQNGAGRKESKVAKKKAPPKRAPDENRVPINATPHGQPSVVHSAGDVLSLLACNVSASRHATYLNSVATHNVNMSSPFPPPQGGWLTGGYQPSAAHMSCPPWAPVWLHTYSPVGWES